MISTCRRVPQQHRRTVIDGHEDIDCAIIIKVSDGHSTSGVTLIESLACVYYPDATQPMSAPDLSTFVGADPATFQTRAFE